MLLEGMGRIKEKEKKKEGREGERKVYVCISTNIYTNQKEAMFTSRKK